MEKDRKETPVSPILGKQSVSLQKPVYMIDSASIVGKKEGEGPLGDLFDLVGEDDMFGAQTWEDAESTLQKEALGTALRKAGWRAQEVRYLFAGDLLGQEIATSFGLVNYELPLFGLYGACSTMGEALSLGAMAVNAGYANQVLAMASSHFATAEKFEAMLRSAAHDAGVQLRQIESRQQSCDHPILWGVDETDYLKFYLFQVV